MAANETDSRASEMPRITPVSCTGKKPFGHEMYSRIVAASVATVTSSVVVLVAQHHCSVRP